MFQRSHQPLITDKVSYFIYMPSFVFLESSLSIYRKGEKLLFFIFIDFLKYFIIIQIGE